ncbi:MAG TPA: S8 family serine peptidase [Kiritimatiellia bacterium]|nr:S8 family serine peptidase [Kiritimatiellia bacterium]HRZ13350.1 S8 family serine peptidase [Kiritimatiellia bacterium]HSA19010.1 S8 family serine peptidase [Kiritimatiellia bacterium]
MKLLCVDSQGERIHAPYRDLLPDIELRGTPTPEKWRDTICHEHGSLCGWLLALPAQAAILAGELIEKVELVFCRIFDQNARFIPGSEERILEVIREERPDVVSRSWGQWDLDDTLGEFYAQVEWADWAERYAALQAEIGFLDVGAAGNDDDNDKDDDVVYPQRLLNSCCIIGAAHRSGKPAPWSGDGAGVLCVMWGDRVYSPDATGRWRLWSGTSAATPKFAGAAALRRLQTSALKLAVMHEATRPTKAVYANMTHHAKWGFGNWEEAWQKYARLMPQDLMPPPAPKGLRSLIAPIEFFDFSRPC